MQRHKKNLAPVTRPVQLKQSDYAAFPVILKCSLVSTGLAELIAKLTLMGLGALRAVQPFW